MRNGNFKMPLFKLGQITATPGAIDLLERTGIHPFDLLLRHLRGDWGVVCEADASANTHAVTAGTRIISCYELGEQRERLLIITESDRSATTCSTPSEY
jgi:hypothetical protein